MSDYSVITAACVVADEQGQRFHLYFGAPVPEFVKGAQLDRLESEGFIAATGEPISILVNTTDEPIVIVPAAGVLPVEMTNTGAVVEAAKAPASGTDTTTMAQPHGNARPERWREYAVSQGVPAEDVATLDSAQVKALLAARAGE